MSTTVTYKDQTLTTAQNQTKVLETAGKYMEDDVTITDVTQSNIKEILIRPDAELVKTYSYDKYIVDDEGVTLPAYTTTATTLLASSDLTPTITLDYTNYNYYVVQRTLTIPEYSVTSKAKGRVEYQFSSYFVEVGDLDANTMHTMIDTSKYITSRNITSIATNVGKMVYWTSGSAITCYSTAAYGTYQTMTAPTISSSVLTLKTPALATRGSTTYFTSTYMNALTDIRYQWIIEVWRSPKGNLNIDKWGSSHNMEHIIECVNTNSHDLT